jgi:putative lipoprotein
LSAALAVACCSQTEQVDAQVPPLDESSITSVWHKTKLRGVSFRAIGQVPGWLLEITTGTELLLVTDYGETRTAYPYVKPEVDPEQRRTRYVAGDGEVVILLEGRDCTDVMSGEQFSVTVAVTLTERQLSGCGRALH